MAADMGITKGSSITGCHCIFWLCLEIIMANMQCECVRGGGFSNGDWEIKINRNTVNLALYESSQFIISIISLVFFDALVINWIKSERNALPDPCPKVV